MDEDDDYGPDKDAAGGDDALGSLLQQLSSVTCTEPEELVARCVGFAARAARARRADRRAYAYAAAPPPSSSQLVGNHVCAA